MDASNFKFIDLFAGIGGIRLGVESGMGGKCVFSSEWDKFAQATYEANFGERPHGDITAISPQDIPDHDLLLAGFPCQAFSICGEMKGFADTRGTLFFNIEEILRVKKPYCFLLENVKQLKSHDNGKTFSVIINCLESLGYRVYHSVLNSLDYGVPQKRERTFIVGFRENIEFSFPRPALHRPKLDDILESDENVDRKYFISQEMHLDRVMNSKRTASENSATIWHQNKSGNVSILPYSCALRAGASYNYLLVNGKRRPTDRELLRLQGYPDSFKIVVPYTQLRKQAGNSVSVPVIRAIAGQIKKAIEQKSKPLDLLDYKHNFGTLLMAERA
jgi:DNA (cytosine-5)-methyltransferase 1